MAIINKLGGFEVRIDGTGGGCPGVCRISRSLSRQRLPREECHAFGEKKKGSALQWEQILAPPDSLSGTGACGFWWGLAQNKKKKKKKRVANVEPGGGHAQHLGCSSLRI